MEVVSTVNLRARKRQMVNEGIKVPKSDKIIYKLHNYLYEQADYFVNLLCRHDCCFKVAS